MNNDKPQAETKNGKADDAKVEVQIGTQVPQLNESQKLKQEYVEQRQKDAVACTAEFAQLLKKYNCFTVIEMTFDTLGGKPRGNIRIHPRN